ncbi:sodium/calcium exchanger protein, partial [Dehalococcoidia bacterium]|nr:sodium/calcium exchanger protein [Dehalococcoidia bacterium]
MFLACAILAGVPALTFSWSVALTGGPHLYPWAASLLFGGGIVGAAFLLAWGAEVAQLDISQALALAIVALVAILPEFAVDIYLAWQAGVHPDSAYASYASANLTGGNRLIVGFGLPLVVLLFWIKGRKPVVLNQSASLELAFLILGAVYSILIFLKGSIALWDTVVLFPLFGLYIWISSRAEHSEPELVGPSV